MYIFKIYSSSTIHQTTTFNLKCIFVNSHAHPLSKNWLSQHIFKNRFQIDANDLNLRVAKCIFSNLLLVNNTPDNTLQPQMHICPLPCTPFEKISWVSIFLTNRFQIDANERVAKCIFSISTPHQQYTRQQPSISNANLSTPMHPLWKN